jgi:integrase
MGEPKKRRSRHEGGLYRKHGVLTDPHTGATTPYDYWQAAREVPAEFLPDGVTRKRITGSGKTQAEARKRLDENYATWLARRSELATQPATKRRHRHAMTLHAWFLVWQHDLQYTDLSDTMRVKYAQLFRDHIDPYLGTVLLRELTTDQIRVLLGNTLLNERELPPKKPGGKPRTGKPLQASARRNVYRTLSVILNAAVAQGRISKSPLDAVKPPKVVKPQADVVALATSALALMDDLRATGHPDYCRMLIQYLGLRQSERLGLTWSRISDLDGPEPALVVDQQLARHETGADGVSKGYYIKPFTKTRKGRTIVIPEPFLSVLRDHRVTWLGWQQQWLADHRAWEVAHAAWTTGAGPRKDEPKEPGPRPAFADLVFLRPDGGLITPKQDTADWHAVLASHNLPYWRAHLNRHITATLLANLAPAPPEATVRSILGHETEAMLLYYTQISTKRQRAPMKAYGETFTRPQKSKKDGVTRPR